MKNGRIMLVLALVLGVVLGAVSAAVWIQITSSPNHYLVNLQERTGAKDFFPSKLNVNVYVYRNDELVAVAHNIVTNAGMGALRDAVHGTSAANARFIALSTDSAAVAYTDTTCPSEITTGGLARASGTVSTQAGPANGDITVRVENTFTATASHSNVQKACLFTASTGGTLYAIATFSPVSLAANDQLTIRWDFSYNN